MLTHYTQKYSWGLLAALGVSLAACSGGGLANGGAGAPNMDKDKKDEAARTTEPQDDESTPADQPTQVSGAFLVCGNDTDARDSALPADGEQTGCAVVDAATLKRKSCEAHEQVEATYTDGTQSNVAFQLAPATSFWHFRFVVPTGMQVKAVTSVSTCDGVVGRVPARDVDYVPATTKDGAPDLGATVDAEQVEESGSDGDTKADETGADNGTGSDTGVDPPKPAPNHVIFVTSNTFNGTLGTRAGADRLCGEAAASGGLQGEFIALLSGFDGSMNGRFVNDRAVENVMGEIVADKGAIWKGSLLKPVKYDERRRPVTGLAWTGSTAFGAYEAIPTGFITYGSCYNWVSSSGGDGGGVGDPNAFDGTWFDTIGGLTCDQVAHLYCISK
jgi:hypothetical protein